MRFGGARTRALIAPVVRLGEMVAYVETRSSLSAADEASEEVRQVALFGGLVVGRRVFRGSL